MISGDCARAYVAIESAWGHALNAVHAEHYATLDYRGIASIAMRGIHLRNIEIHAASVQSTVPVAIAVIEASDGAVAEGFHGAIPISDLVMENILITSDKHIADLKFIRPPMPTAPDPWLREVVIRNLKVTSGAVRKPRKVKMIRPKGLHISTI